MFCTNLTQKYTIQTKTVEQSRQLDHRQDQRKHDHQHPAAASAPRTERSDQSRFDATESDANLCRTPTGPQQQYDY